VRTGGAAALGTGRPCPQANATSRGSPGTCSPRRTSRATRIRTSDSPDQRARQQSDHGSEMKTPPNPALNSQRECEVGFGPQWFECSDDSDIGPPPCAQDCERRARKRSPRHLDVNTTDSDKNEGDPAAPGSVSHARTTPRVHQFTPSPWSRVLGRSAEAAPRPRRPASLFRLRKQLEPQLAARASVAMT